MLVLSEGMLTRACMCVCVCVCMCVCVAACMDLMMLTRLPLPHASIGATDD